MHRCDAADVQRRGAMGIGECLCCACRNLPSRSLRAMHKRGKLSGFDQPL